MNIPLTLLLMVLLTAFTGAMPAAGEESVAAIEADASAESEDTGSPATAESEASPEDFIPTEEISEDFAVSFPVDI